MQNSTGVLASLVPPRPLEPFTLSPPYPSTFGRASYLPPSSTFPRNVDPISSVHHVSMTPYARDQGAIPLYPAMPSFYASTSLLPPSTIKASSWDPSFSLASECDIEARRGARAQFEDNLCEVLKVSIPQSLTPKWPPRGMSPIVAFQVDANTTLFINPRTLHNCFWKATPAERGAIATRLVQRVAHFILNDPRLRGSLQALGGLVEASVGGGMTVATYGTAAPLGWPVMAHGLDQFITGMSTALTGRPRDTLTSQFLQETGMNPETANVVDSGLSVIGSMGGAYAIQRGWVVLDSTATKTISHSGWVLPENGGGALINGRWYSEHALERMAPRTPQVMAKLEARALTRASAEGLQPGTEEFGRWLYRNGPSPRGIPSSVVEAEIINPGSTNIRVILNQRGNVITIIPGGK